MFNIKQCRQQPRAKLAFDVPKAIKNIFFRYFYCQACQIKWMSSVKLMCSLNGPVEFSLNTQNYLILVYGLRCPRYNIISNNSPSFTVFFDDFSKYLFLRKASYGLDKMFHCVDLYFRFYQCSQFCSHLSDHKIDCSPSEADISSKWKHSESQKGIEKALSHVNVGLKVSWKLETNI